MQPSPIPPVPEQTAAVARAAFRRGTLCLWLCDEFGPLYDDADCAALFPARGQPALPPWRLALVTVLQFLEELSDRQAADAVRARIDWTYALALELSDPGLDFSVLSEFRTRRRPDASLLAVRSSSSSTASWRASPRAGS